VVLLRQTLSWWFSSGSELGSAAQYYFLSWVSHYVAQVGLYLPSAGITVISHNSSSCTTL
jgi:hypothetical protein